MIAYPHMLASVGPLAGSKEAFLTKPAAVLMLQGNPTKPQIRRPTIETDELPAPWSPCAHATAEAAALTAFEVPTFLDSLVPASLIPDLERLLHVSQGHMDTRVCLCCAP